MMNGRSFDHMLGSLKKTRPQIDGLDGTESNPDIDGGTATVQPDATYRGQLNPAPSTFFSAVDFQIFNGVEGANRVPNMQGFVRNYQHQTGDASRARGVMSYFTAPKLPVLNVLATEFAVFNRWFSSIPGPTVCNRSFAHYGTSFGEVGMDLFSNRAAVLSIYERLARHEHSSKIYYYDQESQALLQNIELLKEHPKIFATFGQFVADCRAGALPDYSFIEPNYSDHMGPNGGVLLANDQNPDHHVLAGDNFIAKVYNAIRISPELWSTSAILITYANHGGVYDHVIPPACTPDDFAAKEIDPGTGRPFQFDRLGVRVPAVLVSPWIPRGTVIPEIFDHASIPATVTSFFLGQFEDGTRREKSANTFLGYFSDSMRADNDCVFFKVK